MTDAVEFDVPEGSGDYVSIKIPPGMDGVQHIMGEVVEKLEPAIMAPLSLAVASAYILGYADATAGRPSGLPAYVTEVHEGEGES